MLYFAIGTPADWDQAAHYFSLASQQGDAKSQESYGLMLLQGEGGTQDLKKAALWLNMAATQDRARAQLALGMMHLAGEGVRKSETSGLIWIEKAALANHKPAQWALYKTYNDGLYGQHADQERATYWQRRYQH